MSDKKKKPDTIQSELRMRQNFSMAGAIGRAGAGTMKGASPVPPRTQAITEIDSFIKRHTTDLSGALKAILRQRVKAGGGRIDNHLEAPLRALAEIIDLILGSDTRLTDFVRQVDAKWGATFQERPHFQKPGQRPHPDDEYTHASVRQALLDLRAAIPDQGTPPTERETSG